MATTAHGYPYPLGTDRVMDGDDVIHALADAIDTKLGVSANGVATIANVPVTTLASVSVTFPAGRFTVAPQVVATRAGSTAAAASTSLSVSGIGVGGFTLTAWQTGGTAGSASVHWIAKQTA